MRVFLLSILALLSVLVTATAQASPAYHYAPIEWHLDQVHAPQAWAAGADGHGISVLVIDTGLDKVMAQTVLAGSILPSYAAPLHGEETVACPPGAAPPEEGPTCTKTIILKNPTPYVDRIGHGSFVVCEIACHGTSYDYYGIAPAAKVAMAKVFGANDGASDQDIAAAIRWGVIHRFPIISMSLGGASEGSVMTRAVAFAVAHGTLVVAAAGNDGNPSISYPAADPGVISVSATDRWAGLASYSNYGTGLAIAAPGDWVFGLGPMHHTSINGGGLITLEGTSMATPLVAGALADLLSAGLTRPQARAALLGGADYQSWMGHDRYGAGLLNLVGSLRFARARGWLR